MDASSALKELRILIDDTISPYGWSNSTLEGFLSEGLDRLCEDTGMFVDASSQSITTVVGQTDYTLSGRVISILEARNPRGGFLTHLPNPENHPTLLLSTTQGPPEFWSADYVLGKVVILPAPDAVYTIPLRTWRYPATTTAAWLEIPARYHRGPLEYAAALAFGIHDRERENQNIATRHRGNYMQYVRDAKRFVDRLTGAPPTGGGNPLYVV